MAPYGYNVTAEHHRRIAPEASEAFHHVAGIKRAKYVHSFKLCGVRLHFAVIGIIQSASKRRASSVCCLSAANARRPSRISILPALAACNRPISFSTTHTFVGRALAEHPVAAPVFSRWREARK